MSYLSIKADLYLGNNNMTAVTKETNLDGLEFDGNTVLCRVCGDKASGFHYGVHACEGCKGFFRRSIQQKIQYRPCLKNQQCNIMRVNRNRCQYCRLKKCISVGMSRDAVRFGRVPKREKAKIMEQMQKVNAVSQISMLNSVIESEKDFLKKIIDAHMRTCQFTRAKFAAFFEKAWQNPRFVNCPPHMACPLNPSPDCSDGIQKWEEFSDCFTPAIRNVVNFAKCIPGFHVFSQEDQVTLLKAGTFEVLLVHLACLFDAKSNAMLFASGQLYKRVSMTVTNSAGFLLDSMFDYAERFNELQLTDEEMALFSALVVIASDRPGLRCVEQIERVQGIITQGLQRLMKVNHPDDSSVFAKLLMKIPDLRTLNTLHSEKLLGLSLPNGSDTQKTESVLGNADNPFPHRYGVRYPVSFIAGKPEFAGKSAELHGKPDYGRPEFVGEPEFAVPKSAAPQVKLEGSPIIPHHVKVGKSEEDIILQTPFGTFHRFPQPSDSSARERGGREGVCPDRPGPDRKSVSWCPGASSLADRRGSPDPLEMDIAPGSLSEAQMPKLSPAVSPLKDLKSKPGLGEKAHGCPELGHRRYAEGMEPMDCTEHKVPKMWDYDMRSSRSNSMSSNSSLESQDSAYRTISNPSTPRIYEARSPYSLTEFHSRHLSSHGLLASKESGGEGMLRTEVSRPPSHLMGQPPKAPHLHHSLPASMIVNPRLNAILEHHQSDGGASSKDSSRCSSPADPHPDPHCPPRSHRQGYPGERGSPDAKKYPPCYPGPDQPRQHPPSSGRASCTNGDCSPASRHPELLSRLQAVPHSSPSLGALAGPTHTHDTTKTHQNAISTLKDKILRRIDSQENLVLSRKREEEGGSGEGWEGEEGQGKEQDRRASPLDTGIPHPAYMPFPFPPTTMHPAIMYQYNQLAAMQQFHALQQLQAQQQAVHSQLSAVDRGPRPLPHDRSPRGEPSLGGSSQPAMDKPLTSPVHIKCEPT